VPALANKAAFLGASDAPLVGPGTATNDEIVLFRGVAPDHPGYSDAMQGIVNPRGGSNSPLDHICGLTCSEYTSWSADPTIAAQFAGEDGAVVSGAFKTSEVIQAETIPGFPGYDEMYLEFEYLVKGPVSGAVVVKK